MFSFTIHGTFPSFNEYVNAQRSRNVYFANHMKQELTDMVTDAILCTKVVEDINPKTPIAIGIDWYEPNARRDIDNISYAKKFILDGMVRANVIPDDSQKYVCSIAYEHFFVSKSFPRVEVQLFELGDKIGKQKPRS